MADSCPTRSNILLGFSVAIGAASGIYLLTKGIRYLSQLAEKRQRKKHIEEPCNVCCNELDVDEIKSCVKCINCQKSACRGQSCSIWIPSRSGWECQLCNQSQESISKSTEWLHQQITGRYLSPFSARSEPSLLRNHLSSTPELDRRSEAASSFYGDQKERVREVIEETLAEMLGGSLDNISVNQLHKSRAYLPTWENGEAPGISHVKLKRFIEKVINDAIRLPSFTNEPTTPGLIDDQSLPFFDPKKYQELLATAVLNKIVDSYNYEQRFDSNRDAATDCSDLDNNHNALIRRKVQSGSISSSSIEPESDCSITDPPSNISRLDDFSRRNSNSNPLADALGQYDRNNSSRLNDYLTRHNVPLPDFSIESDSSNEDNASAAKNIGSSWEGNWLFKKKRPGHESPAPVGMLVPCPKEDIKTQIGDRTADELSDLSEAGSDCEDNIADENEDTTQNPLIQNKNIIGGKSPIGIFDELFEQTSLISSSSLPEGDSVYTETKNDYVLGDDLSHDLVQPNNTKQSFKTEEAINSLVDTQTLKNNLSNSKEHEKRPPTKASLEDIPKPKPRSTQKSAVYANTQEIAAEELACSSTASSAIESEGACKSANDDCPTDPTNNTNTLPADDNQSDYSISESMLKKIQCTKASAIQFLVVVSLAPSIAVPAADPEAVSTLAQIQSNGNPDDEPSMFEDEINGNNEMVTDKSKLNAEDSDVQPDIRCIPLPEFRDSTGSTEESNLEVFIPPPVEFSSVDIEEANDPDQIFNRASDLNGLNSNEAFPEEPMTNPLEQCEDKLAKNESPVGVLSSNLPITQAFFNNTVEIVQLTQEQLMAERNAGEDIKKSEETVATIAAIMRVSVDSENKEDLHVHALNNEPIPGIQAGPLEKEPTSFKDFQKMAKDTDNIVINPDGAIKPEEASQILLEGVISTDDLKPTADSSITDPQNLESIVFPNSPGTTETIGCFNEGDITRSFETADGKLKLHNQRSTETNTSINETNSVISEDPFSTCNMETLRKIEKQEKSNNTQQIETNKQADYHEMFGGNELELVSMNNATSTEEAEGLGNITNAHSCDSACAALKSQEVSESIPSTNSEISGNIFVKNLDKIEQTEAPINPVAASTEICIDSGLLPPIVTSDNITLQEDTSAESSKSVSDILPSVLIIQVTENKGNSKDAQETIEKVNKKELVSTAVDILEYKHSEMDTEQQKEQNAKTRFCEDQITSDSVSPREVIQPQETPEKTLIKIQENKSSTLVPLSYRVVEQVSEKEYVCNMPKEEVSLSSEVIHKVECSKLFEEKEADLKDSNLVQSVIPNSANEEKVEEMNAVKSSQDTNFHKALDAQEVMPLCKESALDTNIDIEVLLDSLLTENKDNIKENVVCSTLDTNASEIIKIDLSVDRVSDCPIPKTQSYTESESVMDIKTKKVDMSPDSIAESGIVIDSSLRERIEEEKTGGEEDKLIGEEQSSHLTIEGNSSSQRIDEKRPFDEDKPINQEQPVHPTSYEDSSLVDRIGEETVGDKKDEPICEAQYVRGDDSFLVERIGEEKLRVEEAKAVHQEQSVRLTGKEDLSLMKKIGEEDLSVEEANPIDQEHPFPGTSDEYPFLVERICEEKPFVEEAKPIVQEDKPIVQEQPVHLTSEVASLLVDRSGEIKPSVEEDKTISQENPDCATSDEDSTLVVKIGEAKPRIPEVKIVGHEQSNHLTSDEHSFLVERIGEENPTVKEVEPIGQKQPVYPTSEDDPSLVERIGEQNPIVKAAKPIVEEHPTSEVDCSLVEKTGKEKHSDKEDKLIGETQLVYPIGEEDVSLMEKSKERPKVEEDKPIGEKQSFGKLDEKRADEDNATLIEKISEEKFNNDNANNRSVEQPVCEAKSTFEVKTTCHEEPTSKDKSNCDENTIGEEEQLVNESKPTYEEKTIGEQKTIDGRKSAGVETPNDETISFREEQPFLKCEPASVETPPDINKITSEEESIFEKQPVGEFESTNQEKPTHAEKPTAKEKLNGGEKSLSEDASDDKSTNEEDSIAEENSNSQEYASFNELENSYDTEDLNLSSNAAKDLVSTNASSLDEDEIIEDVISEDLNKESQLTKPQIEVRLANFASEVHSKLANTSMRVSLEAINKALEEVFSTEVDAWEIISTPNMVTSTLTPQSFDDCEEKPFNEEQPVDRGKFTNNIEKFFWDEKPANEEMPHGEREPICEKQPIGDEISASKEKPNGTEKCQSKEQPAGESICANNETSIGEEKPLYEEKVIDKSKSTIEEKPNSEEESSCRKKSISEEDPIGECKSANKQISNDEKNTRIEEHSTSLEKTTNEEKTFNQVIPLPEEKREANSTIEEISCMEAKSSNKENPSNEEIPVDAPSTKDILVEKTIDADPSGARNDEQLCLVETIYTTGGTDDIQLFREHALQASCTGNLLLTQTDDKNLPAAIENQHLVSPELNEELPPEYMDLNGLEIDDAVLVEVSSFTESYKEFKEVIINNIILDSLTTMLDDEEPPLINDGDDNINEEFLTSAETTSKVERENDQTSSTSKILKENSETTEQVESLQSNSYVSPDVTKKEEIGDIPNSDEKQEHYVVFTEIKCSTPSQSEEGYSQRFKKHETTETVSTTKETCMVNIESAKSIAPAEKELHSQPNTGGFSKEPKSNLNEDGKDRVQNEKTSCSAEKDGENMLEAIVDDKSIIKESETKIVVSDNATEYESKIESINQFTCPEGNDFIPENTIADVLSLSQNVQPLIKLASNALPEKANLNQDTTNPILICSSELDVKTEHPINKPEEMPDKLSKSAKDIKTPMIPEQTFKPYEVNDKLPEVLVSPENCQQNSSAPLTASDSLKTMNEPKKEVESSLEFTSDKRIPEKNSDIHISELTKLTAAEESSENSTDSPNVATTAYSKQKVSKISVDALDCQDKTSREFDHQPSPAANSKEHIVTSGLPQESVEKEKEHSEDDKKTLGAVLWKDEIREEVLVTTEVMDPPANIDGEISPSNKKETQYTDNIFKDETNDSKICSIVTEDAKSTPKMFLEGSSILRSKDAEDAGQSVKSELIDSEKSVTGPITDVLKEIQEGDQDNYIPTEATLDQGCVSEIIQHGKESKTSPTVDPEKQSAEPEIGSNDVPIFLQVVVDNPPVNQDKTKESKLGDVDSDSSNLEIGLFIDPTQAVEYVVPDQVSGALVESKTLTPELEPVNVTLATEELQDSSNDDIIEKSDQILKESNPDKTESLQTLTGIKDPLIEPGNGSLQACQQKVWLETTEDQANIAEDNNHVSINLLEVAMKLSAETNSTSSGVITEPSASFVLFEGQLASGKLKSLDDSLAVSLNDETEPSINCLNQVSVSDSRAIIDTSDVNIAASQSEIITEKNSDGKEENVIITSEQSFTDSTVGLYSEASTTLLKDDNVHLQLTANEGKTNYGVPEISSKLHLVQANQTELKNFGDSEGQNRSSSAIKDSTSTNVSGLHNKNTTISIVEAAEGVTSEVQVEAYQPTKPQIESKLAGIAAEVQSKLASANMQISLEAISDALEEVFSTEVDSWEFIPYPCRVKPALTPHNSAEESIKNVVEEELLDFDKQVDKSSEILSNDDDQRLKSLENLTDGDSMPSSLNIKDTLEMIKGNNCNAGSDKPLEVSSPQKLSELPHYDSDQVKSSFSESDTTTNVFDLEHELASNVIESQEIKPDNLEEIQNNPISSEDIQNSSTNLTTNMEITKEITDTELSKSSNIFESLQENESNTFEVIPLPNLSTPVITSEELHAIIEAQKNAMRMNNESRVVAMRHVFHVSFGGATSSDSSPLDSLEIVTESTTPDEVLTEDDVKSMVFAKNDFVKTKEDIKCDLEDCETDAKPHTQENTGELTEIEEKIPTNQQGATDLKPTKFSNEPEGDFKKTVSDNVTDVVLNPSNETLDSEGMDLKTSGRVKKTISEPNIEEDAVFTSDYAILRCAAVASTTDGVEKTILEPNDEQAAAFTSDYETPRFIGDEEYVDPRISLKMNKDCTEQIAASGGFCIESLKKEQKNATTLEESHIIEIDSFEQVSVETPEAFTVMYNAIVPPNSQSDQPKSLKDEFDEINARSEDNIPLSSSQITSGDINNTIEITTTDILNEPEDLLAFENEVENRVLNDSKTDSAADAIQKEVVPAGQTNALKSVLEDHNSRICDISDGAPQQNYFDSKIGTISAKQTEATDPYEPTKDEVATTEVHPAVDALKENETMLANYGELPRHIDEPFIRHYITVENIENIVESHACLPENIIAVTNNNNTEGIEEEVKGNSYAETESIPGIVVTKSSLEIPEISECDQTLKDASENPLDTMQKADREVEQTDASQEEKPESISEEKVSNSSNVNSEANSEGRGVIENKTTKENNDCPLGFEVMDVTAVRSEVIQKESSKEIPDNISNSQLHQNSDDNIISYSTDKSMETINSTIEAVHVDHNSAGKIGNDSKVEAKNIITAEKVRTFESLGQFTEDLHLEQTFDETSVQKNSSHLQENNTEDIIIQQECNTAIQPSHVDFEKETKELDKPADSTIGNRDLVTDFSHNLQVEDSYLKVVSSSSEDISAYDTAPSSFSELSNHTSPSSLTIVDIRQENLKLSDAGCSPCPPDVWSVYPEMKDDDIFTDRQELMETERDQSAVVDLRNKLIDELENLISSQRAFNEKMTRNLNYERQIHRDSDEQCSVEHSASSSFLFDVIAPPEVLASPEEIKVHHGKCKQTTDLLCPDIREISISSKVEVGEEAIVALDACDFEEDAVNVYGDSNEDNYDSLQALEIVNTRTSGVQIEEIDGSFFVNPNFDPADTIPWHAQKDDSEEAESDHTESNESDPELSITPPEIALCYMTPHILDSIPEDLEMAESPPKVETKLVATELSSASNPYDSSCGTGEQSTFEAYPIDEEESLNTVTYSEEKVDFTGVEYCPSDVLSSNTTQQAKTHSLLSLDINATTSDLSTITNSDPHPEDVELSTLPTDQQTCIESSSTITSTSDDTVRTAIESPARKVTVELTNEDVVEAHKRSEATPVITSSVTKSYSVSMSLELTYDPTNNADSQQPSQGHGTIHPDEHTLTRTHAPHPCSSPSLSSAAPNDTEKAPNTQQQQIKFNILKHAAFSQPLSDEEDAAHIGQFSHLLPGSIAEREHKKWYNAVEMPNNPYSREALKRRLSASSDKPIDIPNINSPLDKAASEDKLNRGGSEDEDVTAECLVDYKRYGRDYYINHAKHASGSSKHKLTTSTSLHGLNSRDDKACDKEPSLQSGQALSSSLSSLHRSHSWGDKRSNLVAGGGSTCDIFTARPVRVEESDPILSRATKLEYLSTPDRDFYLLPSEEISSLRSISASEHSLSQAGDSLTPSEDSDTIRVYDLKKQETRLIRDDDESIGSVAAAVKGLSNSSSTTRTQLPAQTPTHARPQLISQRSFRTTIIQRGSTPTAFKFLQPKRRLYDTRRIMSEDTSPVVREEISRTNGTTEKSVIEEDVIPALPSVKALAKVFQGSSLDTGASQTARPKSYSWKSVDIKTKEESTPVSPSEIFTPETTTPAASVETPQATINGVESSAEEPAKESYSPSYEQSYIPAETPVVPPIPSSTYEICSENTTQEKTPEAESVTVSEQINEAATEIAPGVELHEQVIEESSHTQVPEKVEEPVALTESIIEVPKEEVHTPKEPSQDSYSPPYDQKYNPVEPLAETESTVDATKENANEEKIDRSNSLEWKEDNIEIVTAPKDDQQTTPPNTPATEEHKAVGELDKPVIEPTSLLVDISDTLKNEDPKPMHQPTVVEQFLANEKNAALPPVMATTGVELVSELHEEKTAAVSVPASTPSIEVAAVPAENLCETVETSSPSEGQLKESQSMASSELTATEEHTQVVEHTSEQTSVEEHTHIVVPTSVETITTTESASVVEGVSTEETISTPKIAATEPVLVAEPPTPEPVALVEQTRDEPTTETESPQIMEAITSSDSISEKSPSDEAASETTANPINGQSTEEPKPAENGINGMSEPAPMSPTLRAATEQPQQNGSELKRSSEIRFTQEMPPKDRPISPVLVPGKLKSSIAFFENLKNKK